MTDSLETLHSKYTENIQLRILCSVKFDLITGCWLFPRVQHHGYASTKFNHRASYEVFVGSIPEGLVLDHVICDTKNCLNPWHTEPVTSGENTRRASVLRGYNRWDYQPTLEEMRHALDS